MIPAPWDYRAPAVLVTRNRGERGRATHFTGASELAVPLPAAIDLLAAVGGRCSGRAGRLGTPAAGARR